MNLKSTLFAFAIVVISCKSTNTSENVTKETAATETTVNSIKIDAITRGYKETLEATPTDFDFWSTNEKKSGAMDSSDWKNILAVIEKINLNSISTLEAPTDKRLFDGDLATMVIINTSDGIYQSSSFDKQNPPKELEELVNLLYSLKK